MGSQKVGHGWATFTFNGCGIRVGMLMECLRECSLLFSLLEEFGKDRCSSLYVWQNLPEKTSGPGVFVCKFYLNYRVCPTCSDWTVQVILFLLSFGTLCFSKLVRFLYVVDFVDKIILHSFLFVHFCSIGCQFSSSFSYLLWLHLFL